MKTFIKKIVTVGFTMGLCFLTVVAVGSAATKTGSYSKLVGTNDSGNSRIIATVTNTTSTTRFSQVSIHKNGGQTINSNDKRLSGGASNQVTSSNKYDAIYVQSSMYNSGAAASGVVETLKVDVK